MDYHISVFVAKGSISSIIWLCQVKKAEKYRGDYPKKFIYLHIIVIVCYESIFEKHKELVSQETPLDE